MKYKISDLATLLNVSTNTVRRYENMGYMKSVRTDNSNYRYFNEDDVTKFMNVRLLRKFGFTHRDIEKINNSSFEEMISIYENKVKEMDLQINYYTNLRNRLQGNIAMMKNIDVLSHEGYIRYCNGFTYVLYQSGSTLLKEGTRLMTIQEFLYTSPEVQRVYVIKKQDIDEDHICLNAGWAIKNTEMKRFGLQENEFTEKYEKRKSLMHLIKLPVKYNSISHYTSQDIRKKFLGNQMDYMEKNHLSMTGDVLGLVISMALEDGEEIQYILVNIPVK